MMQDMQWVNDRKTFPFAEQIDFHAFIVDDPKCDVKFEDFARFKRFRSIRISDYDSNSQLEEFSAYFTYILDNYDMLPDFVVFIHPDAQEHQGSNFFGINSVMGLISNHSKLAQEVLGYYPLSMQYVVNVRRVLIKSQGWETIWRRVFGTSYHQIS